MDPKTMLPSHMLEQVKAYADGSRTPAEPRNASTVVLTRHGTSTGADAAGSLEVYLLRRHVDMAFAAGMCVFPGGGVDPRDFDHEVDWVGPAPSRWAALLGTDESTARALVCAAVRETFEESGVLFAGPTDDTIVEDTTAEDWEEDRRRLEARELSFTDFLQKRGLKLRTDLLRVWGSWLTPVFEPRRFRAWFFVAELPPGQRTRDVAAQDDGSETHALPFDCSTAQHAQIRERPGNAEAHQHDRFEHRDEHVRFGKMSHVHGEAPFGG